MRYLIAIVLGYLIGNFSTSFLVCKLAKNIDIRKYGSGNAGATNTVRVLGYKAGIVVLIGDILKGVAAVLLGKYIGGEMGAILSGGAAVIGHNWPVFLGFKGGKGIATSLGILFALFPKIGLILFLVGLVIVFITRYVSLASISAAVLFPVLIIIFEYPVEFLVFGIFLSVLALYQHRSNIRRLLSGNENKI